MLCASIWKASFRDDRGQGDIQANKKLRIQLSSIFSSKLERLSPQRRQTFHQEHISFGPKEKTHNPVDARTSIPEHTRHPKMPPYISVQFPLTPFRLTTIPDFNPP